MITYYLKNVIFAITILYSYREIKTKLKKYMT